MRPRLYELVTEQLRTVQQQIAAFQVLERQLPQVLERLQSTAPVSHAHTHLAKITNYASSEFNRLTR